MKKNIKLICIALVAIIIVSVVSVVAVKGGKKEYTLSQYINSGQTIWYEVKYNVAKDASLNAIYVLNNDGTMIYTEDVDKTLGELEQMQDSEIVEYVQQKISESAESSIEYILDKLVANIAPVRTSESWADNMSNIISTIKYNEEQYSEDEIKKPIIKIFGIKEYLYGEYFENARISLVAAYNESYYQSFRLTNGLYSDLSDKERMEKAQIASNALNNFYNEYPILKEAIEECYEKENFEEVGERLYNYYLNEAQTSEKYQSVKAELENYFANLTTKYVLAIATDPSGNDTFGEGICYQLFTPQLNNDNEIEYRKTNKEIDLSRYIPLSFDAEDTTSGIQVYDSYYNGYYLNNRNDECFVTRFDKNLKIKLDEVGTKDILVDPSREKLEALFAE